ncbi:UDP-glucose--hexose-1-phosphate uridylyltransferase [Clostridium sp. UBA1652]|uniref:UDP-glucose--hexose-1-phosphate uridylyltransferase n=1 Tax=Clostridium sp. UBA1652 TaxID=1946348 RepID=UPI00257D4DD5|nr:UDP-glucose--hexose-1-phosphate uridylyltransferase [Clostridium sp. UBA1652]
MFVYEVIQGLLNKAIECCLIDKQDEVYVRNQILAQLKLNDFIKGDIKIDKSIPDLLEDIVKYAIEVGVIEDSFHEKDILSTNIMNCFMPRPSDVNDRFYKYYKINPKESTEYFFNLSKNSNYIQTKAIAKNINYKADTEYGNIDITINLSKPEKNPADIIKEKAVKSSSYPKCLLCIENEGYEGRAGHPARANHRMVITYLFEEEWFLQYSPYAYYNEHCILLSEIHRDMKIDRAAFSRLLSFVDMFPHYFIGSNADLPIVGGSILSHDHYQGGRYEFAMERAEAEEFFKIAEYSNIEASIVKWPMSVIRLKSKDIEELTNASEKILNIWRGYTDKEADIYAYTGDIPHNTITPIARKRNGFFEMDLVLRNNRTTEEHPLGIFHPHDDVHHIKKENIGLIEVMGLAVLPGRLKDELKEVEKYILGEDNLIEEYHKPWAEELKMIYKSKVKKDNAQEIVKIETAKKFLKVLEYAGVFKRDEKGKENFRRFIKEII